MRGVQNIYKIIYTDVYAIRVPHHMLSNNASNRSASIGSSLNVSRPLHQPKLSQMYLFIPLVIRKNIYFYSVCAFHNTLLLCSVDSLLILEHCSLFHFSAFTSFVEAHAADVTNNISMCTGAHGYLFPRRMKGNKK